ncbi:MAG TPA: amino acid ABC transporter ATP-binding protein [Candidatus Aerophobetes bacterium]|uniref:Amino acid ABC transporter ATP-binding protein n=1 Tax=Aerophobetes bacterium TaxID=2030807 RepID=A0A7V5HZK6_UNCAE|nr:amino acid ABC transporter ATP-binding protein [Candidatus Aerophobetes bacterium]
MKIVLKKVNKFYGKLHVLKNLDLTIESGEKVVFIGPSGCGKSTMLFCINALEPIQSGEIWVGDTPVHNSHHKVIRKVRQKVGIVFQQFNLFPHYTALGNVELALKVVLKMDPEQAREKGINALKRVGLGDKLDSYPSQLSGGQQQRVAIARALVMDPEVLLLDEITSALDPELSGEVLEVVEQLAKERGITILFVTHEIPFARRVADRIIFMDNGKVVEEGPPEILLNNPRKERTKKFLSKILHY